MKPLTAADWSANLDHPGHAPCPGVVCERIDDLDGALPRLSAVVWKPKQPRPNAPALLAFHGGGFTAGDPHGCGHIAKVLALAFGVTTIAPSYRLGTSERPVYPGIIHDAGRAWRVAQVHAARLGIDPRRIAVSGESAGCLLAGHLTVRSPLVADGMAGMPGPAALVAQWGPLDFVARWYDNGERPGAEQNLFGPGGHLVHPQRYHAASVLSYATGPLPPALFLYSSTDRTVHLRQGRLGLAAWQAAGAHAELVAVDNIGHNTSGDNRAARQAGLQAVVDFASKNWAG